MNITMLATEQVQAMHGEISVMYDAIKFIYNSFFLIIGLLLVLAGFVTYTTIKRFLYKWIEGEKSKLLSNTLENLAATKQVIGKEYLSQNKCVNGQYVFPAISHKISFTPDLINKIILTPIEGNKVLSYDAWIKKGQLYVHFDNYDPDTDGGVNWIVIYNNKS